ncbi:MAG: DUF1553 domain-containing protein [Candidatus Hydrogenedentes bacterium]|nr:DUF1553 domain-containing protein [Candidatus Hydrogenedentota bacterium]
MFHAAVVHMPIVFVVVGIPLIYFLAVSRTQTNKLRWLCVGFYAVTAFFSYLAVVSGEGAMDKIPPTVPKIVSDVIERHEEMGELVWKFALGIAVILGFSTLPVRAAQNTFTGLGLIASIMLAVWVAILGHFGGTLVYEHSLGTPAMAQLYAPKPEAQPVLDSTDPIIDPVGNPAPLAEPAAAVAPEGDQSFPDILPLDPEQGKTISYIRDIKPILIEHCDECHNPDKPRGNFDSTSVLAIIDGGKKGGPGIVPGKPDESSLVKYIRGVLRPQMPKGEDPLTTEQLHTIRLWIAAGAIDDSADTATPAPEAVIASEPAPVAPETETSPAKPETAPAPEPAPATTVDAPTPLAASTGQARVSLAKFTAAVTLSAQQPAAVETSVAITAGAPSVDELLFSGGPEDLLIKRRNYRMALVPKTAAPPATDKPVNNDIDRFIAAKWNEVQPEFAGEVCDDAVFARRAYLDTIGMIPKSEEVQSFIADTGPNKREVLIDALLARNEDYAAHWTPFWEDALCSNGNHQGGVGTRGNYRTWIFDSFKENKAYDVMTAELLDPHMPNQPLRYILRQDQTRILKSAADTAQVFLGTAMKCAGCHNHFDNKEWPQTRFYGFAAFFSDADLELVRCEARTGKFVPASFVFDMPGIPTDVPKTENERAARIAQLIIDPCNPRFAKTLVNRLWKRFIGTGLFEPADDFREDIPASHPELLEWLAYDFMANGYDIKHTMRQILTSRTYQLKYDAALEDHYDVAKPGAPRYYRSPRLRRMTAEQLLDSMKIALGETVTNDTREYRSDESTPLTRALGRPAARNEVSTARAEDSAVVQTLELLNGDEYYGRIYSGAFMTAAAQRARAKEFDGVMTDMYWSVLNRAPADAERALGVEFLKGAATNPTLPDTIDAALLDDALPEGATTTDAAAWEWVTAPDAPVFSGTTSRKLSQPEVPAVATTASEDRARLELAVDTAQSPVEPAVIIPIEQRIESLAQPFTVGADDVLYAYVYIDANDPPKALMLEWREGDSWEHRAYWGDAEIRAELGEGPQRLAMGALPAPGQWVRLEVPAHALGLGNGAGVTGIAFVQLGGTAYWDKSGALSSPYGGATPSVGDALWALLTSPEFQYIR